MPFPESLLVNLTNGQRSTCLALRAHVDEQLERCPSTTKRTIAQLPRGRYDSHLLRLLAQSYALDGWHVALTGGDGGPTLTFVKQESEEYDTT